MKFLTITIRIVVRFFTERFYDQSAQMAYYFMLSLFPFLIFLFSLIGLLQVDPHHILEMVRPFAPTGSYQVIQSTLESILTKSQGQWLSFSLIAAFWLASMAIQSLVRSLNKAYKIQRDQSFFLQGLLSDLLITLGFMLLLSFSLFIPVAENIVRQYVLTQITVEAIWYRLWFITKWGFGSLFLFFFFTILYKVIPSTQLPWKTVLPGALFTTISWQLVSIGFSNYVGISNYTELYGQLGSIIVLMIWFYLTAAVLLIGGLINAAVYKG